MPAATRALCLLCALLFAAAAHAAPTLDQEHAPTGNFGALAVASDRTQVQTFTVGITGVLTRIDLQVSRQPLTSENLDLSVWSTDAEGLPKALLSSASVPVSALDPPFTFPFVAFDLRVRVPVTQGELLAIELDSAAPNDLPPPSDSVRYLWQYGGEYTGGSASTRVGASVFPQQEDLHFRTFVEPLIRAAVQIQRGNGNNRINPRSQGVVQVAILSTDSFDATTLDLSTIRFGKTGVEAPAVRAGLNDVNGDRRADLVLHFRTSDTGILCGDTTASISGQTVNGQPVQGADALVTVGCR